MLILLFQFYLFIYYFCGTICSLIFFIFGFLLFLSHLLLLICTFLLHYVCFFTLIYIILQLRVLDLTSSAEGENTSGV